MYIRGAMKIGLAAPEKPSHLYLENDPSPLLDLHYLRISPWLWFSITTTHSQSGQFLAGNHFAEGKATKLSSPWADRHQEVLKVPFFRNVVVILAARPRNPCLAGILRTGC